MKKPYIPFTFPNDELIDKVSLFNKVIKANKEIAIYNEKLKNSKIRPSVLMDLFSLKEALESSKIEGTQATMDEMLEYRSDDKNVTDDIKEVINYHIALQEGVSDLERLPISSRLIKNLHKTLLGGGVRGGGKTPGEFRTIQNYIGTQGCTLENASYIPPEPQLVDSYMSNLEKFINEDDETNDLIKIALIHSQFETIHPFLDGNGRIGRILIPLYLYNKGFISSANLFVSESLEKDKYKYYSLLNSTRVIITDKEDDEEQYKKDIVAAKIIYSDEKPRNRKYYFYDLINILR
jgi:Fic family protein